MWKTFIHNMAMNGERCHDQLFVNALKEKIRKTCFICSDILVNHLYILKESELAIV